MQRLAQHLEDRSGDLRDGLLRIRDSPHEMRNMSRAFGYDQAELGQMTAQGIDDLGSLPHQEIARPEHESGGLCLLAACVCSLLGATKRMVGRWAASQIASASAASFFWRLTKGFT
jgi:hypothetical protein